MAKTFVITGTSRGLGAEFVKQLSVKGHTVFACARNPDKSEALKSLVDDKHVYAITMDTTNEASVKAAAQKIQQLSPQGIDVLVNNAAICGRPGFDTINSESFELRESFETNVVGTSIVTQEFLPLLRSGKTRKIIYITTSVGSIKFTDTFPRWGVPTYRISKAALNMYAKLVAEELRQEDFAVLLLHPGHVKTDMGGPDGELTPEESIEKMTLVIGSATKEDTGKFLTYENEPIPW